MIVESHSVFPTPDIKATADFYRGVLGFRVVQYLDSQEPHICLYRDGVEIILTSANRPVVPNRELYGYGYDAYFITDQQTELLAEFTRAGIKVVREIITTDYHNEEFVIEDIDGRWLGFGIKTPKSHVTN